MEMNATATKKMERDADSFVSQKERWWKGWRWIAVIHNNPCHLEREKQGVGGVTQEEEGGFFLVHQIWLFGEQTFRVRGDFGGPVSCIFR